MQYKLKTPVTREDLAPLRAGDTVLLAGMGAEALPGMGAVSITERSQFMFRGINRGIFLRFGQ